MDILEATHSPNPSQGNAEIAIVDDSALESQGDLGENIIYPQSDQISVYVVHKGDTLSQIAKMYGVSVNTILWANDIQAGPLSEGETLTILPISGVRHIVKDGETIQSITKHYGGDLNEVLQFNNINIDTKLNTGDEIIIPDGESAPVVNETSSPESSSGSTTSSGATIVIVGKKKVIIGPGTASKFANLPDYGDFYAAPLLAYRVTQGIHGYNGVDLAAPIGTPIMASAPGTILISKNSGWNGGYGNYVVVAHSNGTETLYAHMEQTIVSVGQHVEQGQVVGYIGVTGNTTGPHVHFEIRGALNRFWKK